MEIHGNKIRRGRKAIGKKANNWKTETKEKQVNKANETTQRKTIKTDNNKNNNNNITKSENAWKCIIK